MEKVDVTMSFPEFAEQHLGWRIKSYTVARQISDDNISKMIYAEIVDPNEKVHIRIGKSFKDDNFESVANETIKTAIEKFYDDQEKGITGPIME